MVVGGESGINEVIHDSTLSGKGTTEYPLGAKVMGFGVDDSLSAFEEDNVLYLMVNKDILSGKTDISAFENCCSSMSSELTNKVNYTDLSSYATKDYVISGLNNKVDNTFLATNYYLKTQTSSKYEILSALNTKANTTDLNNFYLKTETSSKDELNSAFANKADRSEIPPASNYSYRDNLISGINSSGLYSLSSNISEYSIKDISGRNITSALYEVIHDNSLSGKGTNESPLGVQNIVQAHFDDTMYVVSGTNSFTAGVNSEWLNDRYQRKDEPIIVDIFPMSAIDNNVTYQNNVNASSYKLQTTSANFGQVLNIDSNGINYYSYPNNSLSASWYDIIKSLEDKTTVSSISFARGEINPEIYIENNNLNKITMIAPQYVNNINVTIFSGKGLTANEIGVVHIPSGTIKNIVKAQDSNSDWNWYILGTNNEYYMI